MALVFDWEYANGAYQLFNTAPDRALNVYIRLGLASDNQDRVAWVGFEALSERNDDSPDGEGVGAFSKGGMGRIVNWLIEHHAIEIIDKYHYVRPEWREAKRQGTMTDEDIKAAQDAFTGRYYHLTGTITDLKTGKVHPILYIQRGESLSLPPPKKTPKPKKTRAKTWRDVIFEAVKLHIYNAEGELSKTEREDGRIPKAVSVVTTAFHDKYGRGSPEDTFWTFKESEDKPDGMAEKCARSVALYVKWWKESHSEKPDNPVPLPLSPDKIGTHYRTFLDQFKPDKKPIVDHTAQMLAEAQARAERLKKQEEERLKKNAG